MKLPEMIACEDVPQGELHVVQAVGRRVELGPTSLRVTVVYRTLGKIVGVGSSDLGEGQVEGQAVSGDSG